MKILLNKLFIFFFLVISTNDIFAKDCCTKPKVKGIPYENAYSLESNSVDCLVGKYALFTKNNKYGLVDSSGNVLIKPTYLGAEVLNEGFFVFKNAKNKLGIINYKNQLILPFDYDEIRPDSARKFVIVSKNGKYGEASYLGKMTIPLEYDGLTYLNNKPFLLSYKNNKAGMISKDTKTVLANNLYNVIIPGKSFNDNIVVKDGLAYYINDNGIILSQAPLP